MPFQKGNKLSRGGNKGNKGGRPSRTSKEITQTAAEVAQKFIEENVKPVLGNYLRLARGYYETRYSENGTEYEVFVPDGPTTRHFIDKILPEIKYDGSNRPINIQIVVEAAHAPGANGNGATATHAGNDRAILVGSE